MQEEISRDYFVIIPAAVRFDKKLSPNAKLLFGDIWALCNKRGYCWATNGYFAQMYGVRKETISRLINELKDENYINIKIDDEKNRSIKVLCKALQKAQSPLDKNVMGYRQNCHTPLDKNVNHNNTYNNTSNNTINKKKESYDSILSKITDSSLKNEYYEYIKMRKLNKSPLTNEALKLLMERVDSLADNNADKISMLKNAIMKNYKTVYPPDKKTENKGNDKYAEVMEKIRNKRSAKFKMQNSK